MWIYRNWATVPFSGTLNKVGSVWGMHSISKDILDFIVGGTKRAYLDIA